MRAPSASAALATATVLVWLAAPSAAAELWLEVHSPPEGSVQVGPVGLVLVRGFAGVGNTQGRDVVILVDTSSSTLEPAGHDVDGDGRVGRRLRSADDPHRHWNPRRICTDPGDTILRAELQAARSLAAALTRSGRSRVAIVTFDAAPRTLVPLGAPPPALDAALASLEAEAGLAASGATNLAAALDGAGALLAAGPGEGRAGSVVLLSDGRAWLRGATSESSARETDAAAERLAAAGVRVHAFALGGSREGRDLLARVAARTGGERIGVASLDELTPRLAAVDLARVAALDLRNATAELAARAVRLYPDGAFDAVLPLQPGENRLLVRALGPDGGERTLERQVIFEQREARTLDEARAVAADLEELHRRTLELELAATVERGRAVARERLVELESAGP